MIYSPATRIAFAHYPKTGGSSVSDWFKATLPDAFDLRPGSPHVPVGQGLEHLDLVPRKRRGKRFRAACRVVLDRLLPAARSARAPDVRIIGVVREPFSMLVSLYEFWQRRFHARPRVAGVLDHSAGTKSFREFIEQAVVAGKLPSYEWFFDIGGPAWPRTRLLDFRSLAPALEATCRDFGIAARVPLGRSNAAPRRLRSIDSYREEADPLMPEIRRYFRWYYEEGERQLFRGEASSAFRAA
jgi:hypothetical protein